MRYIFSTDAEKGIGEAQYYYALQYQNGYGVKQDESVADCWFKKSAAGGLPLSLDLGH